MERYLRGDAKRCRNGFKFKDPYCNPKEVNVNQDGSYPWEGTRCRNGFNHKRTLCVPTKKRRLIVKEDTVFKTASAKKTPENPFVDMSPAAFQAKPKVKKVKAKAKAKHLKTESKNPFVDMSPAAFQGKKTPTPEKFDWFGNPLGVDKSLKNKTPDSVKYPVKSKNKTKRRRVNSVGLIDAIPTKTETRNYKYTVTEKPKPKAVTPKRNALARWFNPTPKKNTVRKNKTPKKGWFGQDLEPTPIVTHRKTATPRFVL